jgi:hypothetical protein
MRQKLQKRYTSLLSEFLTVESGHNDALLEAAVLIGKEISQHLNASPEDIASIHAESLQCCLDLAPLTNEAIVARAHLPLVALLQAHGRTGDKETRRQETGDRRQETGDRRQETGDRRQETGKKFYRSN